MAVAQSNNQLRPAANNARPTLFSERMDAGAEGAERLVDVLCLQSHQHAQDMCVECPDRRLPHPDLFERAAFHARARDTFAAGKIHEVEARHLAASGRRD